MAHGVRKVNEFIVRDGRALIMTQNVAPSTSQTQWDSIADGTFLIMPDSGDLKYKRKGNNPKTWTKLRPGNLFDDLTITGNFLADYTIPETKYIDQSISTRTIKDRNVTSPKIAIGALLTEHFAENSLDGKVIKTSTLNGNRLINNTASGLKITDRTLPGVKIVEGGIGEVELGQDAVLTRHIKNEQVTSPKIGTSAVLEKHLGTSSVTTPKVADLAITNPKLGEKAVDWKNMADSSVRRAAIMDEEVIESKLGSSSVSEVKIKNKAVTEPKLGDLQVSTRALANKGVTLPKLEDSIQNVVRNAVIHDGDYATVKSNLKVQGNIVADPNNLTRSITGFKVYNPVFADYAEGFKSIEFLKEGDIVEIDDFGHVKKAEPYSRKVIGVVSERYGLCLDASHEEIERGEKVAVGLIGKVPVTVAGKVEAGDFIISSGEGVGIATKKFYPGAIVGKALTRKESYGIGKVLCLIQAM